MKTINITRAISSVGKRAIVCCGLVLAGILSMAQVKPVPGFEVLNRQPVQAAQATRAAIAGSNAISVTGENIDGKPVYRVTGNGMQATVPALSQVDVAKTGGRIWVYGDSVFRHSAVNAYAQVYSSSGALIRSLGLLGTRPYAATVADNGFLAFAGNVGKGSEPAYLLTLFDANGNKRWSAQLPLALPSEVYVSDDGQYVAVSLFFSGEFTTKLLVYDGAGKLLHTLRGSTAGVAFLPSKKMVVCKGTGWTVYDMAAGFKPLHTGTLPGVTVGRFPVSAHPSTDIFSILSLDASGRQVSLQAYDARTGALQAQGAFAGKGYQLPYRQLVTAKDGSIRLSTENEVVTVKLK